MISGASTGMGKVLILRREGIIASSARAATGRYLFGSKRPMVRSHTATLRVRVAPSPFHSFISTFSQTGFKAAVAERLRLARTEAGGAALNSTGLDDEIYNRKPPHECIVPHRRHRQSSSAPLRYSDLHPRPASGDLDIETRPRHVRRRDDGQRTQI